MILAKLSRNDYMKTSPNPNTSPQNINILRSIGVNLDKYKEFDSRLSN
jgi:hypothetical protein